MRDFFIELNIYLSPIAFLFTLATFYFSARINTKVNQHFEKTNYIQSFDQHLGQLGLLRSLVDAENFNPSRIERMTRDFTANIVSRYSFLPIRLRIRMRIWAICTNYKKLSKDKYKTKYLEKITTYTNLLEKEKTKHGFY